jgi:hypothetical protein
VTDDDAKQIGRCLFPKLPPDPDNTDQTKGKKEH